MHESHHCAADRYNDGTSPRTHARTHARTHRGWEEALVQACLVEKYVVARPIWCDKADALHARGRQTSPSAAIDACWQQGGMRVGQRYALTFTGLYQRMVPLCSFCSS
jgi:hypothetical protein